MLFSGEMLSLIPQDLKMLNEHTVVLFGKTSLQKGEDVTGFQVVTLEDPKVRQVVTPPKTNMEPENHLFEKENHLPTLHFGVPC